MIYLFTLAWIVCGILAAGVTIAYRTLSSKLREFCIPVSREHRLSGILYGLLGPIGLVLALRVSHFAACGIRFK